MQKEKEARFHKANLNLGSGTLYLWRKAKYSQQDTKPPNEDYRKCTWNIIASLADADENKVLGPKIFQRQYLTFFSF